MTESAGSTSEAEELARTSAALRAVEAERDALHQFFDTPAIAMTHFLEDGTIVLINETGARNLGGKPDDYHGRSIFDVVPMLAEQTRERIAVTLQSGKPLPVESRVDLPDGERWFRSTYYPVSDATGRFVSVQLLSQDITEFKRMEQMLETTEGRLASILEYAPQLVAIVDPDGTLRYVNRAPEGYTRKSLEGSQAVSNVPPEYREPFETGLQHVLTQAEPYLLELDDLFGRTFEVRLAPIMRDGRPQQVLAFVVDITDRRAAEERERQLEAQVQRAQKLESLGVLAGGIAHDFNNLLVGVLGNAQLALQDVDVPETRQYLGDIVHAAQRAAELCRQMLSYAGRGKLRLEAVDISAVSREIVDLIRASISKRARVVVEGSDVPNVRGDASQLGQVVMNLLTNASDALEGGDGTITLRCGVMMVDAHVLDANVLDEPLEPGPYVFVEVQDTGRGMDTETRRRMFDPFFTSKQLGSGLGLASTLGIVRRHGGAIFVDSELDEGTTVRVALPAASSEGAPQRPIETPAASRPSRVLVVDDEGIVRGVAKRILESAGHEVVLAVDGAEALERYDAEPDAIDAVLLDLTMPRMDGRETLTELRKRAPGLPVLLASGYSTSDTESIREGDPRTHFIAKPYELDALLRAVREALGSR